MAAITLLATGQAGLAAAAATPPQLDLKVLVIGGGAGDATTTAWTNALDTEGVPYTLVNAGGALGSETVTLPALSNGTHAYYNGVVFADSPVWFAAGQLTDLDSFEASFGVRQIDGYVYPSASVGLTAAGSGAVTGTAQLSTAALAQLPELKGPVPFETGSYGYPATPVAGAPVTPWLQNSAGQTLAAVYQHPSTDPQAGVSELALTFNYSPTMLPWLLLAPGLINWVTQNTHLGLYRNYFGQDIDDMFISDNEWSRQYQCTPGATDPNDVLCPSGVGGNAADGPPDVQMSAADVDYVANWEQQTGIKLEFAFNAIGACTAPSTTTTSSANCSGSTTVNGNTLTDPGQTVDSGYPNDAAFVNELLSKQAAFNWITHTWSHMYLGCTVAAPQPANAPVAGSGGSLAAGGYSYEVTAATAYGESEPSTPQQVTVGADGSVSFSWPDAPNGDGPSLSKLESEYSGGTAFWGYNVYRAPAGSTSFGLIGQVHEDATGAATGYSFTDTGATTPGGGPGSTSTYPTATDPNIGCASRAGWLPATSTTPDSSIEQEIGLDDAFAANNGLTNFSSSGLVTGEHSGLENPNMPQAMADLGISVFGSDASRQPQSYTIAGASATGASNTAVSAPRYPSNIYYNASNWPDELSEYNTAYVATGSSMGDALYPAETGKCESTPSTTCTTTASTESTVLANESRIMLGHVLADDPRMSYAHQTNLIGPATQTVNGTTSDYGYTLLTLINNMQAQYNSWYTAPLTQTTDAGTAQTLGESAAWASAEQAGTVTASVQNNTVVVTNSGGGQVNVPVTVPTGTTVNGAAFGQSYGGTLSAWTPVGAGSTTTLIINVPPLITSSATVAASVGTAFSTTVTSTGNPLPALTATGTLPAGVTFTDNGDGTATLAGTPAAGGGGSYPLVVTARNAAGSVTQNLTLTVAQPAAVTGATTAAFTTGTAGTFAVTTSGYPAPALTESGTLPSGLSFKDNGDGTGSISGTAASGSAGSYPVTVTAANGAGSGSATVTVTVTQATGPAVTSASATTLTAGTAGTFAVTATGIPAPALTVTGKLPAGLSFKDNGSGNGTLSGTPAAGSGGVYPLTVSAANSAGSATQALAVTVNQAPAITSKATATAYLLVPFSYTITTTGFPAAVLSESGTLPSGIKFTPGANGTATLSGSELALGSFHLTITAKSAAGTVTQAFTLNAAL
ncbi:putative Ig domain-containing protein [Kitasatospora sp. NBC_01287]|uniref:putative Ig domain-containing protein n=1 Tax=Kitasatospora sp. NBC_01287 TaxID=2903573 RepID=UPI002253C73B|nr:putative Ig domain-containing protein [Kitasatospora sp. NBC_01287]MCX4745638.1 putative Ig domain-containing protein [Kitasatospora sp. NBC_01287]